MTSRGDTVAAFLDNADLSEYKDLFANAGFDDVQDLLTLSDKDLLDLGITRMGHRRKIMRVLCPQPPVEMPVDSPVSERGVPQLDEEPPGADDGWGAEEEEQDDEEEGGGAAEEDDAWQQQAAAAARKGRRRSNTHTPGSPLTKVRTQPRTHAGGDRILVEVIAAKLEDKEKLCPQVKMSICKTVDTRGVPIESTIKRSSIIENDNQPAWHETFEFPCIITSHTFLVFAVNNKKNFQNRRIGLIAIPTKFFMPFTAETTVDNWFPLKLGQGQRTGEIHLRLRVPGGIPSQVGKAFKVTGVKMETRKLVVEVIEGEVPLSHRGKQRSTYVKLTLPDKEYVTRETGVQKDTQKPRWYEAFEFYTEVKNSQYMIVKLKNNKLMSHKTLGIAKIPLLFFLSLKEKAELDSWFPCRDLNGVETGKVRVRMHVVPRTEKEKGLVWGSESSFPVTTPVPNLDPPSLKHSNSPSAPSKGPSALLAPPPLHGDPHAAVPQLDEEPEEAEEEPETEEEGVADDAAGHDDEDDSWEVEHHEEDMTHYTPTRKPVQTGGVYWPPQKGQRVDSDILNAEAPCD
eukprot:Rhum_TRINITY_DN11610_c0_g1::Rhum_TRINITY_DN11610_c0_g1_i1::g.45756::m.45756